MSTEPRLRASDADRQQFLAALQRHVAVGRLSLDEYADRVDQVLLARTHGELAAVTHDLPDEPAVDHDPGARHLLIAFLLALLALAVIGAAVAAFR
jgi:hypothetical protein